MSSKCLFIVPALVKSKLDDAMIDLNCIKWRYFIHFIQFYFEICELTKRKLQERWKQNLTSNISFIINCLGKIQVKINWKSK